MSSRRKQEERNVASLRQLLLLPANKSCFDCGQRGPTYVNMSVGSFVCTSCSGRLRGLTPPHRVKSISMASFSTDEIKFVQQRGNQWCGSVWLAHYDASRHMAVDCKDDQQIKDFMVVKYEKKRFYGEPCDVTVQLNTTRTPSNDPAAAVVADNVSVTSSSSSTASGATVRPLAKLVGGIVTPLPVLTLSSKNNGVSVNTSTSQPPAPRRNVDLLAELSAPPSSSTMSGSSLVDPFTTASSAFGHAHAQQQPQLNGASGSDNFADFASVFSADTLDVCASSTSNCTSAASSRPWTAASAASSSLAPAMLTTPTSTVGVQHTADRYAALKELDDVLRHETLDWHSAGASAIKRQQQRPPSSGAVLPGQPLPDQQFDWTPDWGATLLPNGRHSESVGWTAAVAQPAASASNTSAVGVAPALTLWPQASPVSAAVNPFASMSSAGVAKNSHNPFL